jgi:hypothetical protein
MSGRSLKSIPLASLFSLQGRYPAHSAAGNGLISEHPGSSGPAGVVGTIADWMLDPTVRAALPKGTPRVDLAELF